ncbi:MAG: DUF2807 domain-containing protein [Flavobacteriaceae bacterium]|nr:DUF2807 domain-containing protein [Flavobacteriaceae bacterium]
MIRYFIIICLTFGCISVIQAQKKEKIKGNRNVTTKETIVDAFHKISLTDKFKIDIIEGITSKVFIEADDNLHDVIKISVIDSVLRFDTTKKITSSKAMHIKVTYSDALRYIEVQDNAEVSSLTSINLPEMTVSNSGNSKSFLNIKTDKFKYINSDKSLVKLNLEAKIVTLELSENASLEALINADSMQVDMYQRAEAKIEGDVLSLDIRADNSSSFIGKNLTAQTCNAVAGLQTEMYLQVNKALTIDASGNTEIFIYDEPKLTVNNFSGTAKLHKKEMK